MFQVSLPFYCLHIPSIQLNYIASRGGVISPTFSWLQLASLSKAGVRTETYVCFGVHSAIYQLDKHPMDAIANQNQFPISQLC